MRNSASTFWRYRGSFVLSFGTSEPRCTQDYARRPTWRSPAGAEPREAGLPDSGVLVAVRLTDELSKTGTLPEPLSVPGEGKRSVEGKSLYLSNLLALVQPSFPRVPHPFRGWAREEINGHGMNGEGGIGGRGHHSSDHPGGSFVHETDGMGPKVSDSWTPREVRSTGVHSHTHGREP